MVKFNCLIHKETGTVIKYEDWKEAAERDDFIPIKGPEVFVNPKNIVKAKDMLFSDDFEIIYDSEFTTEELKAIKEHIKDENKDLKSKVSELLGEREYYKSKYGIEV